ncbi:MAG: RCC1 domain-containing protein, partial [Polyangiaceae bacterium]
MHRPFRFALGLAVSFTAAALALACGSSSDDAAGSPDGSIDEGVDGGLDVFRRDVESVDATRDATRDATSDAFVFFGDAGPGHQLGTGGAHSCFIRPGGTVRCWGSNSNGQLGNGVNDGGNSAIPVDVIGITDAVELAGGSDFTCARLATGAVKCWGDGEFLGNDYDSGAMSSVPVDVVGLDDAVQIAAGSYHACALRVNHHVVCWGANSGRIGDGTTGDRLLPTEQIQPSGVGNIDDAVSVACGWGHTCVAHIDGSVTCSGEYQPWGQLGDGTVADQYTPVEVQNMSGAVSVGAGLYTSY